ncbi:MAG: TRAP transporter large permease [Treponema sp.]|jgi:tripartite ATP-independent transporter DctM subunit|nr:TRAP transporter large permease [Treponema sp.]
MGVLLVILFIGLIAIGVPISFALGAVSFTGIALLDGIPNMVVFTKMFNGLGSFTLLAVPLFILAANLMNEGSISDRLINVSTAMVGHVRGGLAHANVLVSMVFAGISGSSQADTAGIGKVLIPAMESQGYDKETAVGVTAASSTLGSIIPPSIIMVVYAGVANVSTGGLFMTGILPGVMLGLVQMAVIFSKRKQFPKGERLPLKDILRRIGGAFPALVTPVLLIGGIVSGVFTPTEAAAVACIYALFISFFVYRSIKVKDFPRILIETMKLSSLSLFALATACALGELLSYYRLNEAVQGFFTAIPGGSMLFLLVVVFFFLFVGTFMDAVPAIILFTPIVLPSALSLGISPIILGLIMVITLAMGLVTPPYGLCLLLSASISGITIERAFRGVLPYLLVSLAVLVILVLFPGFFLAVPKILFPNLY